MDYKRIFYRDLIEHDHVDTDSGEDVIGIMMRTTEQTGVCPVCKNRTKEYRHVPIKKLQTPNSSVTYIVMESVIVICKSCNWWQSREETPIELNGEAHVSRYAYSYHAVIEQINIASNNIAIDDLRKHLITNWNDRKLISSGKAESLVKSLLKEHLGCDIYSSTSNVNTSDGGIDLYVCHENGTIKSAVQVKRRINKDVEYVAEVRNFVGALAIKNINKGIFVTTADRFSSAAEKIPVKLIDRIELDLIDGRKLFEILNCYTRPGELIMPPRVKPDSIWVDCAGSKFNTIQVIYGNDV